MEPTYLDYNATTPLDPRVFETMAEWFLGPPANAGSRTHTYGQRAKEGVEAARGQVASVLGAQPEEIVFTSGATESNNLAILGLAEFGERTARKHIVSTTIEHKAVLEPLDRLRKCGFEVELAPVTEGGYVEPEAIAEKLRPDTLLVSVMHANNETGILQPIREIGELLEGTETLFHTDAAQTFGKEIEGLRSVRADFVSVSGHKIHGPQGVGALFARRQPGRRWPLQPIAVGGGQERGLRPGTVPVALVAGLGAASVLALEESSARGLEARTFRQKVVQALSQVEHRINGNPERSQPHVINVSFPGVDGEALLMALRESIAASNGSACTTASYTNSHVLVAMGLPEELAESAVRLSWGPGVGDEFLGVIADTVSHLCL